MARNHLSLKCYNYRKGETKDQILVAFGNELSSGITCTRLMRYELTSDGLAHLTSQTEVEAKTHSGDSLYNSGLSGTLALRNKLEYLGRRNSEDYFVIKASQAYFASGEIVEISIDYPRLFISLDSDKGIKYLYLEGKPDALSTEMERLKVQFLDQGVWTQINMSNRTSSVQDLRPFEQHDESSLKLIHLGSIETGSDEFVSVQCQKKNLSPVRFIRYNLEVKRN